MDTWDDVYENYRLFVSQSLSDGGEVLVISPDNDDLPAEECTSPVVVGSYEQIDSVR